MADNSTVNTVSTTSKKTTTFINIIERFGNLLPHPVVLFLILSAAVIGVSGIASATDLSASYYSAADQATVNIEAVSLMSQAGLQYIFTSAVENFTSFAPLGTVLVTMLGVGVAEWTGLISAVLKNSVASVPKPLLSLAVVVIGICANLASDVGHVVVIPLAAIIFANAGRHPIAGLAAGFAGVSAGFSANLFIAGTDALLVGITNEAMASAGINFELPVTANWYFMFVSTFILAIAGAFVTDKIVEPKLGEYTGEYIPSNEELSGKERKGLRNAAIVLIVFIALMAFMLIPETGAMRSLDPETGAMTLDTFMKDGLLFTIFLVFLLPGTAYGITTNKIKNSNDFVQGMAEAMAGMSGYIVLVFFSAQLIEYFSYTNLGTIMAVKGADFLQAVNFTGFPLIIAFILVVVVIDLFIGSGSAKWSILAPIFVPMFSQMKLSPALTLAAYRIGDSAANVISPLNSFFPMVIIFAKKYDKKFGIGTLISIMMNYTLAFLICWIVLLGIWFFLGLPLGPGVELTL